MTQEKSGMPATQEVKNFAEMEAEFMRRIAKTVWCTMATADRAGRPRTRIIHPIWETVDGQPVGYIATGRHSLKAKHLARNPWTSFTYWDPDHQQVYVEAQAEWLDDMADKQRIWDLYKNTPPPLGYDPSIIPPWRDGPASPEFGVLRLAPSRIELFSIGDMMMGKGPAVWRGRP
jgi:general stress protein 26